VSVSLASDITELLADFGESVTIGGAAKTVIFSNEFESQSVFGLEVESAAPVLTCKTTDVSAVVHGTAVVARSTNYTVRQIQSDGTGITLLMLTKD